MIRIAIVLGILWTLLSAAGCAVPRASTAVHTAAAFPSDIENEIIIQEPFDSCWEHLVSGLSSQFFVINNVEKASGLITLDFSSGNAERFVECGTMTRTYGDSTITYATAGDAEFPYDEKSGVSVLRVNCVRRTDVSGKINVHVAPVDGGTKVTVNARYVWGLTVGGTFRVAGSITTGPTQTMEPRTYSKSFNTRTRSDLNGPDDFQCGSTGELERMILDIVRHRE